MRTNGGGKDERKQRFLSYSHKGFEKGMDKMKKKDLLSVKKSDHITESDIISQQEQNSILLLESVEEEERNMKAFYDEMTTAENPDEIEQTVYGKLRSYKRTSANIGKAYQRSIFLTDELSARWKDLCRMRKKRFLLLSPPANSEIDLEENRANFFARGLNLYKLLLVCFIGSFAGVIVELFWCLLNQGYFESRAGLVYGPFNLLYGVGAVGLTVVLYPFRNKGGWISFLGGFLVGSLVEYFCSWLQELIFGSRSWDYSSLPMNLNGRICLLYSVFWGVLGVFWVKNLYPWMAKLILKLPNRVGKWITWILVAFFLFDAFVTVLAVFRWSQRLQMVSPSSTFWSFLDSRFPDERMSRIFANMQFNF